MSEPQTEAGRRLLTDEMNERLLLAIGETATTSEEQFVTAILAIEQEARADLAARIVAAVEGLDRAAIDTEAHDAYAAVLVAIREASDERA